MALSSAQWLAGRHGIGNQNNANSEIISCGYIVSLYQFVLSDDNIVKCSRTFQNNTNHILWISYSNKYLKWPKSLENILSLVYRRNLRKDSGMFQKFPILFTLKGVLEQYVYRKVMEGSREYDCKDYTSDNNLLASGLKCPKELFAT